MSTQFYNSEISISNPGDSSTIAPIPSWVGSIPITRIPATVAGRPDWYGYT